jgi:hypothetical protein
MHDRPRIRAAEGPRDEATLGSVFALFWRRCPGHGLASPLVPVPMVAAPESVLSTTFRRRSGLITV